jgi:hypothetical protein
MYGLPSIPIPGITRDPVLFRVIVRETPSLRARSRRYSQNLDHSRRRFVERSCVRGDAPTLGHLRSRSDRDSAVVRVRVARRRLERLGRGRESAVQQLGIKDRFFAPSEADHLGISGVLLNPVFIRIRKTARPGLTTASLIRRAGAGSWEPEALCPESFG